MTGAAETHARDLKAKRPSPLIHLLFPPSHEAPAFLPPSCYLKMGLSFRTGLRPPFWLGHHAARLLGFCPCSGLYVLSKALHFPEFFHERRLRCSQHQVSSGTLFQLTSWRHKAASALPGEAA